MQPKQSGERGISFPLFQGEEVSMNKCSSEDIERAVRKSEGASYRGWRVISLEGRPLGEINFGGDTLWVHRRPAL